MFDFSKNKRIADLSSKNLDKLENAIIKAFNARSIKENLHLYLIACVDHAVSNKSADRLTNFFNRLPNNANKRGVNLWVQGYTTLEYGRDKAGNPKFIGSDKAYAWTGKSSNGMYAGMTTPFWEMDSVASDQTKNVVFNFDDLIKGAIDKANKAAKKGLLSDYDKDEVAAIGIALAEFRKVRGLRPSDAPAKPADTGAYSAHGQSAGLKQIELKATEVKTAVQAN